MIALLNLLACGSGEPAHGAPDADAHAPAASAGANHPAEHAPSEHAEIAPEHSEPDAHGVHEEPASESPAPGEHAPSGHAPVEPPPDAAVGHAADGGHEATPAGHAPEPVGSATESTPPVAVEPPAVLEEPGRALGVLLRPLLLALPVLLGVRLLGAWVRRRLPYLRSGLFLAELAVLSGVLLWVAGRVLVLLESVSLTRPGMVLLGLLAVAVLPVMLRLIGHLRGLWLIASGTLRVGDTVETATIRGTIQRIGLLQLTLCGADGETVIVRYDALSTASIRVAARRDHAPVELWVERAVDAEQLRRTALLSPYRRAGTPVQVSVEPDGGRARVRMVLWSPAVESEARALLQGR